jgi:hypothetical protein
LKYSTLLLARYQQHHCPDEDEDKDKLRHKPLEAILKSSDKEELICKKETGETGGGQE